VTPSIPAGEIAIGLTTLSLPFQVSFGSIQATLTYAGLNPEAVGLYQFDVLYPPYRSTPPRRFRIR